ncbi:MAG TPA: hypothetical protein VGM70_02085 [Pseudolysinimonas sp.]|jgi:hypothetical protein
MFRLITITATAGALALASLACATPALAATPVPSAPSSHSTLAEIQQAGAVATADRIRDLTTGIGKVDATSTLSAADKSTVLAALNHDMSGMQALQSKIAADTVASAALADYHSIFTGYRVYAVGLQQTFIAATADGLTGTAIPKLQSAATRIAAVFAADPSKATPDLQAKLADMQARTADAVTKTSGLAAAALAVTPDAYNANHSVLMDDRSAARNALADSKAAAQDGRAILAALT